MKNTVWKKSRKKYVNSSEKYKPKLVVSLSRFPYPIEKGDKLRIYYQLKDLCKRFEIYLICTSDQAVSESQKEKLSGYCQEIHVFELRKISIFFQLIAGIFSSKPLQIAYFTNRSYKKKIERLLDRIQPDHIFCQLIRPAEYVKNYHRCPKTIDIMDALSKGMERRMEHAPWFLKFIFREESKRLRLYERQILNYFEQALIISEQDKQFIFHPKKDNLIVIPNGVSEDFFQRNNEAKPKQVDLLFTGNMSYAPNIEAAKYIHSKVLPQLLQTHPGIRILISGASPGNSLLKLANEHFIVSGWVDDIRDSYRSARIFIAPMLSGTGMQNKLLEAMAMGLPCVTTTLANNAILAKANEEILIADTVEELIAWIEKLLTDEAFRNQIAQNGQAFVAEHYNWEKINQRLGDLFEH